MYNLRVRDGDLVTKNLNTFNNMVSQLLSVDIKIVGHLALLGWLVASSVLALMSTRLELMKTRLDLMCMLCHAQGESISGCSI